MTTGPVNPGQPSDLSHGTSAQTPHHSAMPGYEFTRPQDDVIRSLSQKMKFVGVFYVVASAIVGCAGLAALFISPAIGILYLIILTPELLIGIWTIHAANSFQRVVETSGYDIPHLMNALAALRKLYTLMFWLLIAALVFMVLAVAVGVFLWSSGLITPPTGTSTVTALHI
jgi:hypothetical protein